MDIVKPNYYKPINLFLPLCGPRETDKRKDCYFYYEEQDMGAHIPCCLETEGYTCPCSPNCKNYISKKEIHQVVKDYIKRKRNAD